METFFAWAGSLLLVAAVVVVIAFIAYILNSTRGGPD